jgi:uroporphyrinogen decarboxylase
MKRHPDGSLEDEWGLKFKEIGLYNEFIWNYPLKDIEDASEIENHTWPNTEALGRTDGLEKEARKLEDENWAVSTGTSGIIVGGLFEIAWWLRGYNNFMVDLYTQPKIVCALFDKILAIYIELFDQYLGAVGDHVNMVMFTDDIGAQTQMIIPPKLYRQYLKPRHKKLFDFIHSRTDAKLLLHTCGSVDPVINDLIEVGVDILNPVQPRAYGMKSEELKRKYGDKLCFHGGFDIQRVLPFGTKEEIENEAKRRIKAFAPGGGYIFCAAHNIQPDVPPQNVITMYKAAEKFGRYPINSLE